MNLPAIRRIVTGHNSLGKSVVTSDGALAHVAEIKVLPGTIFHEVWSTCAAPAPVDNGADPTLGPLSLSPPQRGTRLRFVDIPPESADHLHQAATQIQQAFELAGDPHASTASADAPHPLMHRTESVDYGVVIEGEITLVLDKAERLLKPGNVVIQRGTSHAWANRSGRTCRMLFVLVDGQFSAPLEAALAKR